MRYCASEARAKRRGSGNDKGEETADVRHQACPRALTAPFGRQGTSWEVAYAARFLISNESSHVNAHTLFLEAGHMAGVVRG